MSQLVWDSGVSAREMIDIVYMGLATMMGFIKLNGISGAFRRCKGI